MKCTTCHRWAAGHRYPIKNHRQGMQQVLRYHEITSERKPEFVARGYKGKHFFPHRCCYLPYALPEQARLGAQLWDLSEHAELFSLLFYGDEQWVGKFPQDLFFDPDVMIHGEHHGRPGLVASAHLYVDRDCLYTDEHQSDLVQRIHLRRDHKSQIEKRFGTWHHMLLNSILHFAVMKGLREIHVPTSQRVVSRYIGREVRPDLFVRLYDENIKRHYDANLNDDTWVIDVSHHKDKLVPLHPGSEPLAKPARTLCILHDLAASKPSAETLDVLERTIETERACDTQATYNLPPDWIKTHQRPIEDAGHAVGFLGHLAGPYRYLAKPAGAEPVPMAMLSSLVWKIDYWVRRILSIPAGRIPSATDCRSNAINAIRRAFGIRPVLDVLQTCRQAEYYVRGYRQTAYDSASGLTDEALSLNHFEWLITQGDIAPDKSMSEYGLFKFPVAISLDTDPEGAVETSRLLKRIDSAFEKQDIVTLALPIDGQQGWVNMYPELLSTLQARASLKTIQSVVNAHRLAQSV